MTTAAAEALFPLVDAATQDSVTDEQAQFFLDQGLLVIRNLLRGKELEDLRAQTMSLIEAAAAGQDHDPDFRYADHQITGKRTPFRVEYVIDKRPACRSLLGHPFILKSVEKLQGRDFIPTWDSMVFKMEGAGAEVPWHRDAGRDCVGDKPIFNVDFYLDTADETNCLWGLPGTNHWSAEEANEEIARRKQGGFSREGAVPILMNPGDVLFHNILALHGSPPTQSALRRVVYYEFRPIRTELERGPHTPEYIPAKQRVLLACLRDRARSPYGNGEKPFIYRPSEDLKPPSLSENESLETYRYPHGEFWRDGTR